MCPPSEASRESPGDAVLEVEGVRKRFVAGVGRCRAEVRALDGVTLRVTRGEVIALVGRAGSGKSTLLLCVAGLLRPDAGRIRVAGVSAARADPCRSLLLAGAPGWRALRRLERGPDVLLVDDVLDRLDECDRMEARERIGAAAALGSAVLVAVREQGLVDAVATRVVRLSLGTAGPVANGGTGIVPAVRVAERAAERATPPLR